MRPDDLEAAYLFLIVFQSSPAPKGRAVPYRDLDELWRRRSVALREKTLWRMLYETAARASEVLALDVEDLDRPQRRARVVSKGNKSNTASAAFNMFDTERAPETHWLISVDEFQGKALRLLKMAREALIYLSLAMHREEALRTEESVV